MEMCKIQNLYFVRVDDNYLRLTLNIQTRFVSSVLGLSELVSVEMGCRADTAVCDWRFL